MTYACLDGTMSYVTEIIELDPIAFAMLSPIKTQYWRHVRMTPQPEGMIQNGWKIAGFGVEPNWVKP